ncbi:MAG: hypothetical protein M1826_000599 [Phylliscum demangeonii]|nr:MAG: hypothetical protein M1826_000599 [Phylliscum demangeonii]
MAVPSNLGTWPCIFTANMAVCREPLLRYLRCASWRSMCNADRAMTDATRVTIPTTVPSWAVVCHKRRQSVSSSSAPAALVDSCAKEWRLVTANVLMQVMSDGRFRSFLDIPEMHVNTILARAHGEPVYHGVPKTLCLGLTGQGIIVVGASKGRLRSEACSEAWTRADLARPHPRPHHGVLLGTSLLSPEPRQGRWHVVIGGFDRRNRFIRRVHNYDRNGEILPPGQLGRVTSVPANTVDYEPHFRGLGDRGIQERVARDLGRAFVWGEYEAGIDKFWRLSERAFGVEAGGVVGSPGTVKVC